MEVKSTGFLREKCLNEYITIFNSSSFANTTLYEDVKHNREFKTNKSYSQGTKLLSKVIRYRFKNLAKKIKMIIPRSS